MSVNNGRCSSQRLLSCCMQVEELQSRLASSEDKAAKADTRLAAQRAIHKIRSMQFKALKVQMAEQQQWLTESDERVAGQRQRLTESDMLISQLSQALLVLRQRQVALQALVTEAEQSRKMYTTELTNAPRYAARVKPLREKEQAAHSEAVAARNQIQQLEIRFAHFDQHLDGLQADAPSKISEEDQNFWKFDEEMLNACDTRNETMQMDWEKLVDYYTPELGDLLRPMLAAWQQFDKAVTRKGIPQLDPTVMNFFHLVRAP